MTLRNLLNATVVVAFLILAILSIRYFLTVYMAEDIPPTQNPPVLVKDEVDQKIKQAEKSFWQDRDYDQAIETLQEELAKGDLTKEQEAVLKNQLIAYYARADQEKYAPALFQMYAEDRSSSSQAAALEAIAWEISSRFGTEDITYDYVNEVFGPTMFGVLSEGEKLTTGAEVRQAVIRAFKKVIELDSDRSLPYLFIGRNLTLQNINELDNDEIRSEIELHLAAGRDRLTLNENDAGYSTKYANGLYQEATALFYMFQAGVEDADRLLEVADQGIAYADGFTETHFNASIVLAELSVFKMLAIMIDSDMNPDEFQRAEIQVLLDKYLYTLSEEDAARRYYLIGHGGEDSSNYSANGLIRRNSFVKVAEIIDPNFETFLIERMQWSPLAF